MKIIISVLFILMASPSFGQKYHGYIHSLVDNSNGLTGIDSDYVLLEGVTSHGDCRTTEELLIIRIPDDDSRAFSMALAAQLANKEIMVDVNTQYVDANGSCIMRWLKIVN